MKLEPMVVKVTVEYTGDSLKDKIIHPIKSCLTQRFKKASTALIIPRVMGTSSTCCFCEDTEISDADEGMCVFWANSGCVLGMPKPSEDTPCELFLAGYDTDAYIKSEGLIK